MRDRLARIAAALIGSFRQVCARLDPAAPQGGVAPDVLPFLPELDAIIEEPPPRAMQRTQALVALFLVTALVVSAVAQVDIVVRGTGRLATSAPPVVVQPLERAILRELRVKPGDRVVAGQVLATLDPTFAQADWAQLSVRQRSLLAQMQRMDAELAGRRYDAGDGTNPEQVLQATVYRQRQADYTSRMTVYDEDIARLEASIRSAQAEAEGLKQQMTVVSEVVVMRETLLQSQTGSKLNALDARNQQLRTERELQAAINRQAELRHTLAARQAERRSVAETWRRETLEELVKTRDEAARVNEDLVKAARVHELVELSSPTDAIVVEVAKRSLGSVLREAEPLITLVSASSPLIAEIELASADVGYAKPGDPVRVKVDAFPYQRHGLLEGSVINIGMESYAPEGAGKTAPVPSAIHHGQVELKETRLDKLPEGTSLIPGMTLIAEIQVGSRSILSYFLYPVIRGFDESIREP